MKKEQIEWLVNFDFSMVFKGRGSSLRGSMGSGEVSVITDNDVTEDELWVAQDEVKIYCAQTIKMHKVKGKILDIKVKKISIMENKVL